MRPDKLPATISLRKDLGGGTWWPDYDADAVKCYGYVMNRLSDAKVGPSYCKKRRTAIQAGGHAGLWPIELSKLFKVVHTFEAEEALFDCLSRNIAGRENIVARSLALGDRRGVVKMRPSPTAGSWRVDESGTVEVAQVPIDELGLRHVDFIQLDVEGYEPQVLEGARATIEEWKPVIQVELLPRSERAIQSTMKRLGYEEVVKVHNDAVFVVGR